ncbi:MAG: phosphoenolpyruvate--protein phosphotransferase [Lachnospiraceae bacterium]|nr:phosphoenolpyruvate--protein phosphotransferase [Lachnospiraceae bacterium]
MINVDVEKTASRGIAAGPAYKYQETDLSPDTYLSEETAEEIKKFEDSRDQVIHELEHLAEKHEIFAAHLEMAGDFMLQEGVVSKIQSGQYNAQQSVHTTIEEIAAIFAGMDDAYMKERSADIADVGKRIMAKLKGVRLPDLGGLDHEAIVVAKDLYPSDTVKIDPAYVKGIITEEGGITSHVSIMAKSMNIPTLVGVKGIMEQIQDDTVVCMDARAGKIVIDPDESTWQEYTRKNQEYLQERARLEKLRNQPAVTKGGKRVSLCANIGNLEDLKHALVMNIDGVGLFRSEFLYMENDHFPTEEEQYKVYKEAATLCPSEVTIRTLDIGGDKKLPYFQFDVEENPFLGWRAIRISLDMKDMFKEQLRAILRASAYGHVRIMFPMIISPSELQEAKGLVEECKAELSEEGHAFDPNIETGMMMETPASVMLAEEFAKEADFFSIGTNDLTQYLLSVDRGNKKIAKRYDSFHPAVLKAIKQIIDAGHKENIKVGMCGEMAGDAKAVSILAKMGLDEFSMSAGSIDYARELILQAE